MSNSFKCMKFVLAACPRSATAYSARLLSNLGLECGHETYFKFKQRIHRFLELGSVAGDASWLAVPFLDKLPPHVRILHQTRHPLHVIRSLQQIRFFDLREDGQPVRQGLGLHFTQFAFRHCTPLLDYPTARERAIWFYYHWNKMIESAAEGHRILRFAIEEFDQDQLVRVLAHLHVTTDQIPDELQEAHLELLPRNINAKISEKTMNVEEVRWDDLPNEVQELAISYGYGPLASEDRSVDRWTDAVQSAQNVLRKHAQVVANAWRAEQEKLLGELTDLHQKLRNAKSIEQALRHELDSLQRERFDLDVHCDRLISDERESEAARLARDTWMCGAVTGDRVLDASCGDGERARMMAREGLDVTALDTETHVVEPASSCASEGTASQHRLRFVNGTIATLDYKPDTFDTVILSDLLTRITRRPRLLELARHCLVAGGRLIACVPLGYFPNHQRVYATLGWDLLELIGQYFHIIECDFVQGYLCLVGKKPDADQPLKPATPTEISNWLRKAGEGVIALQRQQFLQQHRIEAQLEEARDDLARAQATLEHQTREQQRAEALLAESRDKLARSQAANVRLARGQTDISLESILSTADRTPGLNAFEGGILFFCTNGAGLGHLTRALAIARRIRRIDSALPLYFLSSSPALSLISREKIIAYHIPTQSEYGKKFNHTRWNELLLRMMRLILATHRPTVLVYDGVSPFRGLLNLIGEAGLNYSAMVLRLRHKHDRLQNMLEELNTFDEMIFPGESGVTLSQSFTSLRHRVFDPIVYLDREELLPREEARRFLGIPPERKAVFVQLGAGNINDTRAWHNRILSCLQKHEDVEIVVAESPISTKSQQLPPHTHVLSQYPNSLYFNAFDMAVSAVGYNTYHELMHFGVPAVLIPNQKTITDDQVGRARAAEAVGAAKVVMEIGEIDAAIDGLLHDNVLKAAKKAATELVPTNSAMQVAQHVLDRASAKIETRLTEQPASLTAGG